MSDRNSRVHRILKKTGRLKIPCYGIFPFLLLLIVWGFQPHEADASLEGLVGDTLPAITLPSAVPPALQQTAEPQTTASPSPAEAAVPETGLLLPALDQVQDELPKASLPADNLPAVNLPEVSMPQVSIPEVDTAIPTIPVDAVIPDAGESIVPQIPVVVPKLQPSIAPNGQAVLSVDTIKRIEPAKATPEPSPSIEPADPTSQSYPTIAVTATPKPGSAPTLDPGSLHPVSSVPVIKHSASKIKTLSNMNYMPVKAASVPLPLADQRPYRFPVSAIWVNSATTGSSGTLQNSGQAGPVLQVYNLSETRLVDVSSSGRVYYTIFAKSDQWAQAPPGQPPQNFSSQPKKN